MRRPVLSQVAPALITLGLGAALLAVPSASAATAADRPAGGTAGGTVGSFASPASGSASSAAVSSSTAPGHDQVVSAVPGHTPTVLDGSVWAFAEVGDQMVVGGKFTEVQSRGSDVTLSRPNIFIFDEGTGQVSTTAVPALNGKVETLLPGPVPGTVFAGGEFTQLNGANASHLALIDVSTGLAVPGFKAAATNGVVNDLRSVGNRLYAGGFFTTAGGQVHQGLATFNASTGKLDPYMGVDLAEHHNNTGSGTQGSVGAKSMDVSPDGTRLVVVGNFRTADGLPRDQAVLIDLTGAGAAVRTDWRTRRYEPYCSKGAFDSYMRGVDFSVDGSFFVAVTTGGPYAGTLCDTAARFETNGTGDAVEPTWIDETGGDTLWSVETTEEAVYIGGHNRWLNNTNGRDNAGAGAVPRPGVAALDPDTGLPVDWNPGRNPRGVSAYELYATPSGLWLGHDTAWIGNFKYNRGKMVFFPLAGGHGLVDDRSAELPGTAYLAAKQVSDGGRVLYRVNAGGPALPAQDVGPDWAADTSSSSSYHSSTSSSTYSPSATRSPTLPAGTPTAVFDTERYDPSSSSPDMNWFFPVPAGAPVEVRLYFANRSTTTRQPGQRRFTVRIDGSTMLSNYDIVADVGHAVGTMKSFPVTSDGTVNIDFSRVTNNPLVNGIEIVRTDKPAVPDSALDGVSAVPFDGTTAGAASVVDGAGVAWRQARGAFWLDGTLYTGWADGTFTARSFDGTTFGASRVLDPWADPVWAGVDTGSGNTYDGKPSGIVSELSTVSGMFYRDGRLYYTLNGSSTLYWRWFSPDSGVVGAARFSAPAGFNYSGIRGMFYADDAIYAASASTGDLLRIPFAGNTPSSTATTVTGPSSGGVDWRGRALFVIGTPPNKAPSASFTTNCTDLTCSVDPSGSSDPDGSIASYAWDYGDGSTATGPTPDPHGYATPGTYVVTLTVTDDDGASAQTTRTVQPVAPNSPPEAAFTVDCLGLVCSVDGRGSTDADGAVAAWAWDFAGTAGKPRARTSHRFGSDGTYEITLTVTDDDGASDSVAHEVTVNGTAQPIEFVDRVSTTTNQAATVVTIPAAAQPGDTAVLFATHNVDNPAVGAPTGVTGWTQEVARSTTGMVTTVWSKVLQPGDPGSAVTVTADRAVRTTLTAAVWSGVDPGTGPVSASASSVDTSTTTHTTPEVEAPPRSLVVSYWSDKSSATTAWTAPPEVVVRGTSYGGGAGRVTALLADSSDLSPAGAVGGLTATTNATSTRAVMVTLTLAAPPAEQSPTGAFARSCTNQHCSFDASGSTDPDGTVDSFTWDFGDGETGTGVAPEHDYDDPGPYDVTLTVTDDDGLTDQVTHEVQALAPHVEPVAATKANGNVAALTVPVPGSAVAGDTAVLLATHNAVDPNLANLPGWTLEDSRTSVGMVSTVWTRTLTAADAGSSVTVTADRALRTTLSLAVYRGVAPGAGGVTVTSAAEASGATHTTPTVTTTEPTWVLSYFADKSSATTAWVPPPGTQPRLEAYTGGAGRVTSLLVDSGNAVAPGTVGGFVASTDASSTRAVVMTVLLRIAD